MSTTSYGGASFSTFGYEHVTDTATQTQAALHWVEGGSTETFRITGTALAADTVVGQRLIANEPMVRSNFYWLEFGGPNLVSTVSRFQFGVIYACGYSGYNCVDFPGHILGGLCQGLSDPGPGYTGDL